MSNKYIVLSGKELIRLLKKIGFVTLRIKGSHHILVHEDGRMKQFQFIKMKIFQKDF